MQWWDELAWSVRKELLEAAQVNWTCLQEEPEEVLDSEEKRQWISDQLSMLQFAQGLGVSILSLFEEQERVLVETENQTQGQESTLGGTATVTT